MFGAQVKFALGLSLSALISAQVLAHFHLPSQRSQTGAQPQVATNMMSHTQAAIKSDFTAAPQSEHRIAADQQGQYFTDVDINGARLRMLVDTGATSVALSYEDAAAAGVFPFPSDYKYAVSTANGVARVARIRLNQVRVGQLVVRDVEAVVGEKGALSASLLGMTFLSRLSKIESARGTLVLRQ
jgi:aspartyl protease family protein